MGDDDAGYRGGVIRTDENVGRGSPNAMMGGRNTEKTNSEGAVDGVAGVEVADRRVHERTISEEQVDIIGRARHRSIIGVSVDGGDRRIIRSSQTTDLGWVGLNVRGKQDSFRREGRAIVNTKNRHQMNRHRGKIGLEIIGRVIADNGDGVFQRIKKRMEDTRRHQGVASMVFHYSI